MKILFFVSGSIHSNFSSRALSLAKALKKLGNETAIVAPIADKYSRFIPKKVSAIDGVRILQPFQFLTKRPEINLTPYLFGAAAVLFRERPDFIYIYKPTPISVVGLLAKLFWKTPIIVDMDDLGGEVMKIEGHPWYQRKLVEWSEYISISYADRFVAASAYLYDIYHHRFPKKPIHLMPNGVDAEWFSPVASTKEPNRIVFMGSINRKNILEPLFDALPTIIKRIPKAKVVVIGDGKYLPFFKEKNENLHLRKNVDFLGWLEIAAARDQLRAGDIGYNYMPRETTVKAASNMKLSQYMARGVVPIVSDINDLSQNVDFKAIGYVAQANDPAALETALLQALADQDRLERASRARTFAQDHFNWDRLASTFSDWLALNNTPARGHATKPYENATR